jgi:MSHA biogenesis protein MshO
VSIRRQQGFTLIELVVVILIAGALSIVMLEFITMPINVYVDQSRRARLVGEAQSVMHRLAYDVRLAVPNSVRVGCGGGCVELMRAATGGRYRAAPPGDTLSFVPADGDTQFEALGTLNHTGSTTSSADPDACADGTASCVVVYNTGFSGTDLWAGDNAATLTSLAAGPPSLVGFDNSRFSSGQPAFPAQSPGQRFYITDTPVTYLCDTGQGTVRRYWGYSRRASQTDVDSHAELVGLPNPAEDALVARDVSACQFQYSAGTPTRNATLRLRLSISDAGETITLLEQVNVGNVP